MTNDPVFAEALRALMCDTNIGLIKTWGYILELPPQIIEGWFEGKGRPTPKEIADIICCVENTVAGTSQELANFREVLRKQLSDPPQ